MTPCDLDAPEYRYVSVMLVTKNTVAATAVLRLRKLAEPLEPNRLPAEPEPKDAPMSAPLPCCNSTNTISTAAVITCTTQTIVSNGYLSLEFNFSRRCISPGIRQPATTLLRSGRRLCPAWQTSLPHCPPSRCRHRECAVPAPPHDSPPQRADG